MASDLKSDLVMMAFQRRPTVHLMGNPAVVLPNSEADLGVSCLHNVVVERGTGLFPRPWSGSQRRSANHASPCPYILSDTDSSVTPGSSRSRSCRARPQCVAPLSLPLPLLPSWRIILVINKRVVALFAAAGSNFYCQISVGAWPLPPVRPKILRR